jgi:hypothetical protein
MTFSFSNFKFFIIHTATVTSQQGCHCSSVSTFVFSVVSSPINYLLYSTDLLCTPVRCEFYQIIHLLSCPGYKIPRELVACTLSAVLYAHRLQILYIILSLVKLREHFKRRGYKWVYFDGLCAMCLINSCSCNGTSL